LTLILILDGFLYFVRGLHLQDFGFPRVKGNSCKMPSLTDSTTPSRGAANDMQPLFNKRFKWKKINYKTFLPKHAPVVAYIVAKTNNNDQHFMMHAAASTREFNTDYTKSEINRTLKKSNSRLLEEDQKPGNEIQRVIVCHIKHKDPDKEQKRQKPCKQFRK
jgi:hypothetical protein